MENRPPAPVKMNWTVLASYVLEWYPEAVDGPFGTKLKAQKEAAEALGLQWSTLRNYLAAAQFANSFQSTRPEIAEKLRRQAIDVVRAVARWSRWDPDGAFRFLMTTPYPSTPTTLAAEKAARRKRPTVETPTFFNAVQEGAPQRLEGRPCMLLNEQLVRLGYPSGEHAWLAKPPIEMPNTLSEFETSLGVTEVLHFLLKDRNGTYPVEGMVMRANQYSIDEGYRREAKSTLFRALALATNRPLVILPFPSVETRQAFLDARPIFPFENGVAPNFPALDQEVHGGFDQASEHVICPGARIGAIVATTPGTVAKDLFVQ